jgi:hypothetical protein
MSLPRVKPRGQVKRRSGGENAIMVLCKVWGYDKLSLGATC